ncbi:PE-PGRS family protein [Mycobacterium vicinigordonae]|uniref:PE-PGRS family protein n=1 Tax=Mycobacterium vicinigordonae TaxID=1719132 RepID=A0A7D6I840_9MYCO|nr:PE-PGRS family protein [Mycobacterium vicinigordonae]QLL09318.1 PE-PGRS family protein [Mycobacterium vicinigordonae]
MKPLVVAGAVATAIAAAPMAAADVVATVPGSPSTGITHFAPAPLDPGGSGCDANGNCGSGGVNQGPGGGPGGQGCIPGVGCGSGGQFAGPGGVPGGEGCLPGVGCGTGHG